MMKRLISTTTSSGRSSGRSKSYSNGFLSKTTVNNGRLYNLSSSANSHSSPSQKLGLQHVLCISLALIFMLTIFMYLRISETLGFHLPKENVISGAYEPLKIKHLRNYNMVNNVVPQHHNDSVTVKAPMVRGLPTTTRMALRNIQLPAIYRNNNRVIISDYSSVTNNGINNKNGSKLKFVYHIGPMKTASTTLQKAHIEDKKILQEDGYLYGLDGLLLANQCLDRKPNRCDTSTKWRTVFLPYLQKHSEENLFLSDEMFGVMADWDGNWNLLQNTIGKTWDLSFIVTYRRFFEWYPSFYFQAHRYAMSEERITTKWPLLLSPNVMQRNILQRRYPNRIPTISAYFDLLQKEKSELTNIYVRRWGDTFGKLHPTEVQKSKFEKHYPGVKVFNFHQDQNNLVGSFYCSVFPGPQSHACAHRKAIGTPKSGSKNLSGSHNYDMLSIAAFDANLINPRVLQRAAVAEAARRHQEEVLSLTDKDFPLTCMSSEQLNTLLEMSLQFEQRMMPEWYKTPRGEKEHREQFKSYVLEQRFCSINATEAIKDENWRNFFRSLNSSNTGRVKDVYGHVAW